MNDELYVLVAECRPGDVLVVNAEFGVPLYDAPVLLRDIRGKVVDELPPGRDLLTFVIQRVALGWTWALIHDHIGWLNPVYVKRVISTVNHAVQCRGLRE